MADDNMTKMVTLRSSDEVEFEVSEAVASRSQLLCYMIEDDCAQDAIPIYNVDSKALSKVIEYCTMHVSKGSSANASSSKGLKTEEGPSDQELILKHWDDEFLDRVDLATLQHLINAANYLDIGDLFDLTCRRVADLLIGKSTEEVRRILNIKNDFTPREEEAIRRANVWAFL